MPEPRKPRVLVVDDDEQIARMLQLVLNNHGFDCVTAYSGGQALARFARGEFQLVITDLSMFVGDGFTLIEEIRHRSNVPIIVVSGFARQRGAEARALGNIWVFPKPVESAELIAQAHRCCSNSNAQFAMSGEQK